LRSDPGDDRSCSVSPTFLALRAGEARGPADGQPRLISHKAHLINWEPTASFYF
jgi:hypothetical protein